MTGSCYIGDFLLVLSWECGARVFLLRDFSEFPNKIQREFYDNRLVVVKKPQ